MARPTKAGLDYFSHDVHARNSFGIEVLWEKHSSVGYATYFCLLELIYAKCVPLDLNNPLALGWHSKQCRVTPDVLQEVITTCCEAGLFDSEQWKNKIVLSHGAQRRISKVSDDRRRDAERKLAPNTIKATTETDSELSGSFPADNSGIQRSPTDSAQSKVKESKVKESKGKKSRVEGETHSAPPHDPTQPPENLNNREALVRVSEPEVKNAVWLTKPDLIALQRGLGEPCLEYLIREVEEWWDKKPKDYKKLKSHYAAIRNQHRMKTERNLRFANHPRNGFGYYPDLQLLQLEKVGAM